MLRYLRFLAVFIIAGLILLMGVNAYFDPFRIYHDPVTPVAYSHIERYRVPGLINESLYRNKDADTLLIGTSMSDNTDVADLAKKLDKDKVLKLILSGGLPEEHMLVMDYAFGSQQVKTVYWEAHSPYYAKDRHIINDKAGMYKPARQARIRLSIKPRPWMRQGKRGWRMPRACQRLKPFSPAPK